MAMVRQEIAYRGWLRYRKQQQYSSQLARPSWDVVNPSLDKLEKEAVVPKEFKISKEEDVLQAYRAAATCKYGKSGFFILLRLFIGFFLPQLQGFSSCKYISFPPYDGVVYVGQQDLSQTLIKELLLYKGAQIKKTVTILSQLSGRPRYFYICNIYN